MSSATPSSNMTHDFHTLPASTTAGVTDNEIAVLSRFLVRSTNRQGGLPLEYPRRSSDTNRASGIITHAPLPGTSGFERSRKVLDALVAIAGCGGTQTMALSVSFGAKVRIVIAQNEECPPPSVSEHLRSVWEQLRGLANVQRNIRHQYRLQDVLDSHGKSPKAAESHSLVDKSATAQLKLLKETLHADIHKHCYMKSKQRIVKYLPPIAEFHRFYLRARSQLDPTLVIADIVFCLLKFSKTIIGYTGALDACGAPVDMDWSDLAKKSSLLLQMYLNNTTEVMAKIADVMAVWGSRSEVKANRVWRRFDLLRALEKTITFPRQIQELVSFAYSPRLRCFLERPVEVLPLSPPTVTLPEPSAVDMTRIVERAFNNTQFATTRRIDEEEELQDMRTEQLEKVDQTIMPPVSKHTVHAEYTLLLHHHSETHTFTNPPPFQYIAVNKLSCFSCWGAYQGYNQITGRIFSLRGSHSKLYFPSCPTTHQFDDELGPAMRAYLYSELVNIYSEHLNHIQDARNRMADSSVASHESDTDNRLQVDSDDVSAARLEREKEEAEMDMEDE